MSDFYRTPVTPELIEACDQLTRQLLTVPARIPQWMVDGEDRVPEPSGSHHAALARYEHVVKRVGQGLFDSTLAQGLYDDLWKLVRRVGAAAESACPVPLREVFHEVECGDHGHYVLGLGCTPGVTLPEGGVAAVAPALGVAVFCRVLGEHAAHEMVCVGEPGTVDSLRILIGAAWLRALFAHGAVSLIPRSVDFLRDLTNEDEE